MHHGHGATVRPAFGGVRRLVQGGTYRGGLDTSTRTAGCAAGVEEVGIDGNIGADAGFGEPSGRGCG